MTTNRRILFNTLASYLRSITGVFLGLWTSRWVLSALGEEDFGIYQMSGVCIVLFSFFNGVISSSASRFYAYGLGKGGNETSIWFANAFWIHLAIGFVFLPAAGITGDWMFRHYFDIPPERLGQALFAFRTSLVAAFASICAAPFLAMFLAKQEIVLQSLGVFLMSAAQFVASWFLLRTETDKLMFYAATFSSIHIAYPILMSLLAFVRYPECRHFRELKGNRLRELLVFSLWNALGPASIIIQSQGTSVAVNKMLGVKRNAAIGIVRQLSGQANALSQSLMTALLPEIATSEGANRKERVQTLSQNASILSTLLSALLAVPIGIEIDYILKLWLKTPPQGAGVLASFILFSGLISKCACGQGLVLNAKGKIREYQLTVAPLVASSVLVAVIGFSISKSLVWVGLASVFAETGIAATGIFWGWRQANIHPKCWARTTLVPIALFLVPSVALAVLLHLTLPLPGGFLRSFLICLTTDLVVLFLAWRFAIPPPVKERVVLWIQRRYLRPDSD